MVGLPCVIDLGKSSKPLYARVVQEGCLPDQPWSLPRDIMEAKHSSALQPLPSSLSSPPAPIIVSTKTVAEVHPEFMTSPRPKQARKNENSDDEDSKEEE